MCPDYDGVKFYGRNDMSVGWYLKKSEPIIESFYPDNIIKDINAIMELFNVQKLFEADILLPEWSDELYKGYKEKSKQITGTLGKFFARINDNTFTDYIKNVDIEYLDDFWELFVRFKVYERVSSNTFVAYLQLPDTDLYKILKHKKLVHAYDKELAQVLRDSEETCEILATLFLEKNDVKYHLPKNLSPEEFEEIFQKYIDSANVNPNVLRLIFDAQGTKECPISDMLRLNAKREYLEYWGKRREDNIRFSICVNFTDQDDLKKYKNEGLEYCLSYDIKWFEENLDYPTILNNFCYVFEMFDLYWRSTLVSVESKISAIEKIFVVKGVRFYQNSIYFKSRAMISAAQMTSYYDFLKAQSIDLEEVFAWFFNVYLPDEFGVIDFSMKASSASNYVERCRTLASEMEGVLKQYRMYARNGKIDRELFEMSSDPLVWGEVPSLILDKYAYPSGDDIQKEMFLLFSDQSTLSYTTKTQSKYSTLFQMLKQEKMRVVDFEKFQVPSINWLVKRGALHQNEDETLELNNPRVGILKDLFDHDVTCVHYLGNWTDILYEMKSAGDIRIENTLFSKPEKDYLNYVLNKSEFSNGLDLRNKYAHSTYPQNKDEQKSDYLELLKIMVLIITKINEEFCLSVRNE